MLKPFPERIEAFGAAAVGAKLRGLSDRIDRDVNQLYAELGEPFQQHWFLPFDLILEQATTTTAIARRLGLTVPAVSQSVRAMVRARLVELRRDPGDARIKWISATPEGRALATRLRPMWTALLEVSLELDRESGGVASGLDRLGVALSRRTIAARLRARLTTPSQPPEAPHPGR